MKKLILFLIVIVFSGLTLNAQYYYTVESPDGGENLSTVDISTGVVMNSVPITLDGFTVDGFTGMTRDNSTGILYVILKDDNGDRHIASLDPKTGIATSMGILGFSSASSLASDNNGTLYACTSGAEIYEVNPADATSTLLYTFPSSGSDGEAIGYNDDDGLIYHYTGYDDGDWETVTTDGLTYNSIATLSGVDTYGFSLCYDAANTQFIFTGGNTFYTLQTDGTLAELSSATDIDDIKGIEAAPVHDVTFNVNMADSIASGYFVEGTDQLWLGGSLNGWMQPGTNAYYEMSESATNDIYTVTIPVEDADWMYKYFKIVGATPSWDNGEWNGDPNRTFTMAGADMVLNDVFGVDNTSIEALSEIGISIYPNPSNGIFTISTENNFKLEIFDISGKLINTQTVNGTTDIKINIAGMYFLRFTDGKNIYSQRVIVK